MHLKFFNLVVDFTIAYQGEALFFALDHPSNLTNTCVNWTLLIKNIRIGNQTFPRLF